MSSAFVDTGYLIWQARGLLLLTLSNLIDVSYTVSEIENWLCSKPNNWNRMEHCPSISYQSGKNLHWYITWCCLAQTPQNDKSLFTEYCQCSTIGYRSLYSNKFQKVAGEYVEDELRLNILCNQSAHSFPIRDLFDNEDRNNQLILDVLK